jgi:hypothetical protein
MVAGTVFSEERRHPFPATVGLLVVWGVLFW